METDKRAGGNIKAAAFSALGMVAISFIFNPFFIMTIGSAVTAFGVIASLGRKGDERFTKHIASWKPILYGICVVVLLFDAYIAYLAFQLMRAVAHEVSHPHY